MALKAQTVTFRTRQSDSLHIFAVTEKYRPTWNSCSSSALVYAYTAATMYHCQQCFYSAATFLAMQSAVLATAIPSVRPSHAGIVPRRMKIGSRGLHCEVAKHSSFLIPTMVRSDIPFHLKFALKVTHP